MNHSRENQSAPRRRRAAAAAGRLRPARLVAFCAAAVLVVWALVSLGRQMWVAMRPPPGEWSPVFAWRANTPPVEDVGRLAERVGARVPETEPILFTLGEGGDDEFFLSMWTAYHLPNHPVLRRQNVPPGATAPRYRLDIPRWPPVDPSLAPEPPGGPAGIPPEARRILEGLGDLWYVPDPGEPGREP